MHAVGEGSCFSTAKTLVVWGLKGTGPFYLTSVVPSVPTRLLSMEADSAHSGAEGGEGSGVVTVQATLGK